MADDDGNQDPPEEKVSIAQIRDAVREVLEEMGMGAKLPPPGDDGDDADKPIYSQRQAEDAAREIVEAAMPGLLAAVKKPPRAKKSDDDGDADEEGAASGSGKGSAKPPPSPREAPPTPPKETASALTLRLRRFLVGADD